MYSIRYDTIRLLLHTYFNRIILVTAYVGYYLGYYLDYQQVGPTISNHRGMRGGGRSRVGVGVEIGCDCGCDWLQTTPTGTTWL